jgi:hypothetical protein
MKKLFLLGILLVTVGLHAESVKFPGSDNISFNIPKGWQKSDFITRGSISAIRLTKGDDAIGLSIFPDKETYTSKEKIAVFLKRLFAKSFAKNSVETEADLKYIRTNYLFGYYATYTDKKLVGKKGKKGDWKYMTTGLLHIKDYAIVFSFFTNDLSSKTIQDGIKLIESLSYKTGAGVLKKPPLGQGG